MFDDIWQWVHIRVRFKDDSDNAELDIAVEKEEEEVDVRMLRSAKVYHDQDSKMDWKFAKDFFEKFVLLIKHLLGKIALKEDFWGTNCTLNRTFPRW